MPQHDVILKMLETLHVMSVREVIPVGDQVAVLIGALYGALSQSGAEIVGPPFTIYHDEEFKPENLDVEVVFPVSKAVQKSLTLPSGRTALVSDMAAVPTAACVIHSGSYDTLAASYEAIGRWIQENGYRISGAPREIYLTPPQSETGPITEIQFPVEKA